MTEHVEGKEPGRVAPGIFPFALCGAENRTQAGDSAWQSIRGKHRSKALTSG